MELSMMSGIFGDRVLTISHRGMHARDRSARRPTVQSSLRDRDLAYNIFPSHEWLGYYRSPLTGRFHEEIWVMISPYGRAYCKGHDRDSHHVRELLPR